MHYVYEYFIDEITFADVLIIYIYIYILVLLLHSNIDVATAPLKNAIAI